MFQFPEFASYTLCIQVQIPYYNAWKPKPSIAEQFGFSKHLRWVAPFGYPWIKAYSQLPTAFRSVSRPSSPVHAKASTKCP